MVATRRSSQRLQEKTTSTPSSPVSDATSARTTGSASKKSPSTGSATKSKRAANKDAERQQGNEVAKELFQAESSQSVAKSVSEELKNEEDSATDEEAEGASAQTEAVAVVVEREVVIVDSEATEDDEDDEEAEVLLMVDSEAEDENEEKDNGDVLKDDDEEEEDISAYVMMAASGINLSTTKPAAGVASSSSQTKASASRFNLVPDALDSGASAHATYFAFQGYKCADGATLVAAKRSQEEQATLKTQLQVAAQSTRQREEHQNKKSAGRKWFDMESEELTVEARRDFALLRMRNYLDPKKFYKTSDHHKKLPKHFQLGVVIEGAHEFKSARLTKKQRQQTFTDEIMADVGIQSYTKRVFGQIQASRSGQGKKKMKFTKRH